jgi:hypothetical protein
MGIVPRFTMLVSTYLTSEPRLVSSQVAFKQKPYKHIKSLQACSKRELQENIIIVS